MPNECPTLELASYLKLNRASPEEWLAAARALFAGEELQCRCSGNQSMIGAIAALEVENGSVVVLHGASGFDFSVNRNRCLKVVVPVSGAIGFSVPGGEWQALDGLAILPPTARARVRMSAGSQLLIVKPEPELLAGSPVNPSEEGLNELSRLLAQYLQQVRFFRDHQHAEVQTGIVLNALVDVMSGAAPKVVPLPLVDDRRVLRVIEKIDQQADWEFDLKELALHSGVSERNLYYLMKRQTGMTPYRYFQRSRLTRVRRRLVDCQCDVPHISWYAADEGFTHLGRFAALYREHFGELPRETVQWRRKLVRSDAPAAHLRHLA
ncbi:helix-turn-helix transcriptional regulator [Marinobacter salinexigens]|uniref:Helix-turn-helix transcriptional regulator n=1 Tax=Marinobacter salinexigens TaxID=2919747 RepID=A0A5B0VLT9_9GAMM|nr:AraC family transcriptional regulator [Marinobacter salinexigens]KAA1175652.1 helix-turn-helix transcriptional regulator [Marinobacter salinexigens]